MKDLRHMPPLQLLVRDVRRAERVQEGDDLVVLELPRDVQGGRAGQDRISQIRAVLHEELDRLETAATGRLVQRRPEVLVRRVYGGRILGDALFQGFEITDGRRLVQRHARARLL